MTLKATIAVSTVRNMHSASCKMPADISIYIYPDLDMWKNVVHCAVYYDTNNCTLIHINTYYWTKADNFLHISRAAFKMFTLYTGHKINLHKRLDFVILSVLQTDILQTYI